MALYSYGAIVMALYSYDCPLKYDGARRCTRRFIQTIKDKHPFPRPEIHMILFGFQGTYIVMAYVVTAYIVTGYIFTRDPRST